MDLAGNRITVRDSKTDAGMRQIDLLPALRDELAAYKAQAPDTTPDAFVFPSAKLAPNERQENIRARVLEKAVEAANEKLDRDAGDVPLPEGLTPHKLRHTFASILVALGVDPGSVMDQLGHADPGFTLRVYRHAMRRDPAAKAAPAHARRRRRLVHDAGDSSDAQPPWSELAGTAGRALGSARRTTLHAAKTPVGRRHMGAGSQPHRGRTPHNSARSIHRPDGPAKERPRAFIGC